MKGILDQMLPQPFRPATENEYIALQFAKKLADESAVKCYVHYVENFPTDQLFRLLNKVKDQPNAAALFHSSLKSKDS